MAMHKTNSILRYGVIIICALLTLMIISSFFKHSSTPQAEAPTKMEVPVRNMADHDSASESLETLTAELKATKEKISEVAKNNEVLKDKNSELISKLNDKQGEVSSNLGNEIQQIKQQLQALAQPKSDYVIGGVSGTEAITIVSDLSQPADTKNNPLSFMTSEIDNRLNPKGEDGISQNQNEVKVKPVPVYTIPANATSVRDKLMTALVGRIPVKGVVTDPYPFKIVISDDNLAANGLRIPGLLQMIASGFCEGDRATLGVKGYVTSVTFVFQDGTISTTSSNDNNIGNFSKENSLGFLTDSHGNPFIPGVRYLTNAPENIAGTLLLGVGAGLANAYAMGETTTSTSAIGGTSTTSVTGSQGKFVLGQGFSSGANAVKQWWDDRLESFDAIYVPIADKNGCPTEIVINFTKEIHIDYNPVGRKLSYAHDSNSRVRRNLD
jgi:hypothetical protein